MVTKILIRTCTWCKCETKIQQVSAPSQALVTTYDIVLSLWSLLSELPFINKCIFGLMLVNPLCAEVEVVFKLIIRSNCRNVKRTNLSTRHVRSLISVDSVTS